MEALSKIISLGLGVFIPIALLYLYLKKKRSRLTEDGPVMGTDADREAAERELAGMPSDIRVQLAMTKDVIERYSTHHGFTETYLEMLVQSLRSEGIDCEVVFRPAAMPGVAGSFLQQHGEFELWVEKTQLRQAAELLRNRKN